MYTVVILN